MPPCHEHMYHQRRYMRAELSALWKTTSEDEISPDQLINIQESFTPDLYVLSQPTYIIRRHFFFRVSLSIMLLNVMLDLYARLAHRRVCETAARTNTHHPLYKDTCTAQGIKSCRYKSRVLDNVHIKHQNFSSMFVLYKVMMVFSLSRNIFQDVMHKDTLVKSFIDEVWTVLIIIFSELAYAFGTFDVYKKRGTCLSCRVYVCVGFPLETRSKSSKCVLVPFSPAAAQEGPDAAQIYRG